MHQLAQGATEFLTSHGYASLPTPTLYRCLAALSEQADTDRTGLLVLDKLKTHLSDPHAPEPWRKKQEIWRLVCQLQVKCKLHTLRSKTSTVLPDLDTMAREVTVFWSDTLSATGLRGPECSAYLKPFFASKPLAIMAKMLIEPVTVDVVHVALENLSATSFPGIDGFTSEIYKTFASHFVPLMLSIYKHLLDNPKILEPWSLALFNPIPKGLGLVGVHNLQPLVLQNFNNKWIAAIVALPLEDFISAVTPMQQRGFIKGRYIFDSLWQAFSSWSKEKQALYCPIDFGKAFDSVSHECAEAFFTDMCIRNSSDIPYSITTRLLYNTDWFVLKETGVG